MDVGKVIEAVGNTSDFSELVGHFVDFRDQKEQLKRRQTDEMEPFNTILEAIENRLLARLQETGQDSAKTKFGTAYKKTGSSTKVADWNVLIDYIKKNDAFDLLVKNVAKEAVKARLDETGELVPGVDIVTFVTAGVRRA